MKKLLIFILFVIFTLTVGCDTYKNLSQEETMRLFNILKSDLTNKSIKIDNYYYQVNQINNLGVIKTSVFIVLVNEDKKEFLDAREEGVSKYYYNGTLYEEVSNQIINSEIEDFSSFHFETIIYEELEIIKTMINEKYISKIKSQDVYDALFLNRKIMVVSFNYNELLIDHLIEEEQEIQFCITFDLENKIRKIDFEIFDHNGDETNKRLLTGDFHESIFIPEYIKNANDGDLNEK